MNGLAKFILIKSLKFYTWLCSLIGFNQRNQKSVLILKIDGIGDYILLRNFLLELKQDEYFGKRKLVVLGNSVWQNFAEYFDREIIDEFIWLDLKQKNSSKWYFLKFLLNLGKYSFEYALYPTYSREQLGDSLMDLIKAKHKIAFAGDLTNISENKRLSGNRSYTRLIEDSSKTTFEYIRNSHFFSELLNHEVLPRLELRSIPTIFSRQITNVVVLFVGAGVSYRRWSHENFLQLAKWLNTFFDYSVVLCGSNEDLLNWRDVPLDKIPYIHNLLGQSNLVELVDILSQARFIVSNETSIPHMAVALNKLVFVISNGNHFGRFTSYPTTIPNQYHAIYPPEIMDNLADYDKLCERFKNRSELDINLVTVAKVKDTIRSVLNA